MAMAARERDVRNDLDNDLECRLVSCLLIDPGEYPAVAEVVAASDFFNMRARKMYEVLGEIRADVVDQAGQVDILLLTRTIEARGDLPAVGGPSGIGEFLNLEAYASKARRFAIEVRAAAVRREIRRLLRELDRFNDDADAFAMLTERFQELRDLQAGTESDQLSVVGMTAEQLIGLSYGADPVSPLPNYLDPEPSLHVVHGVAKVGKTNFIWNLVLAWLLGREPWPGAPALPKGRVLVLSAEQGVRKCTRVLRRLASTAGFGPIEDWAEQLTIVGRHAAMMDIERRLLVLDSEGIALLRRVLLKAKADGNRYSVVAIDSLSRVKPPGSRIDESNDDAIAILKPLADLAVEMGVYILLIHHSGHSTDRRGKAVEGVRGASAIRDVPQVLIVLDKHEDPRCRVVRVAGNELPDHYAVFQVANPYENEGFINRFEPRTDRALDLEKIFADGPLGLMEFGRRALNWAPGRAPSGGAKKKAEAELKRLEDQDLIRKEGAGWDLIRN